MLRPLALAAVVLVPLAVSTTGTLKAADEPAWATSPTTGASDGGSDSDTGDGAGSEATGATTETMPPVYEPCGCSSAGEAGGWAALALLFTAGSRSRRRRPTSRRPCFRAA